MSLLDRPAPTPAPGATGKGAAEPATRRRRRWWPSRTSAAHVVLLGVLASAVLHLVWWRFLATSGGDIAAQDAWAEFAHDHPGSAYNLAWYGGMHPVSYSVISPYLMAVVGVRTTMVVSGLASTALVGWLVSVRQPPGWRRTAPVLLTALALFGNAVSGRVTFALGTAFALAAICVVSAWPRTWPDRRVLRGVLTALCAALATAGSPVAGLFLGLVAAGVWLLGRRPAAYALGLTPVLVVLGSALFFPFSGLQPMRWNSAILPAVSALSVVLLAPAPRVWRLVRLVAGLYLAAVVLAWLIPSPVGTNIGRLGLLFGGAAVAAAALDPRWRSSWAARRLGPRTAGVLLVLSLLTSAGWQVGTALRDALTSRPPASFTTDLQPLLAQLRGRGAAAGRVEVVPTRSHREASAIAPYLPLARGWNRQADAERNPLFYRDAPLTAAAYQRWLHRWAVRFVVLPTADPDPAARTEVALLDDGVPGLSLVWSNPDWRLYQVADPTPLVSAPARVVSFDAGGVVLTTPRAGRVLVRVAASPWLSLVDASGQPLPGVEGTDVGPATTAAVAEGGTPAPGSVSCLASLAAEQPGAVERGRRFDFVVLHAATPGTYRIAAPYKLPRGTSCPTPDGG